MKIVQSFWTGGQNARACSAGWQAPIFHYLSWILSCNQLRKYYDDMTLVTDTEGYKLLIEELQLPYTDVKVCLDDLQGYNNHFWALAKIKAYQIMDVPFIHVDSDVYIWERFENQLLGNNLIAQNKEMGTSYYAHMWESIKEELQHIPPVIHNAEIAKNFDAYNMGIFGGKDLPFISEFCKEAFNFVNRNITSQKKIQNSNFNIFFEQVLMRKMAEQYDRQVFTLFDKEYKDNGYYGFDNFDATPDECKYIHLLGFYKKMPLVSNKLRAFVLRYYPKFYANLEKSLNPECKLFTNPATTLKVSNFNLHELANRDITSIDQVRKLRQYLKSGDRFNYRRMPGCEITSDRLSMLLLDGQIINISLQPLDKNILFLKNGIYCKKDIEQKFLSIIDDSFPKERYSEYLNYVWRRFSFFLSLGAISIDI